MNARAVTSLKEFIEKRIKYEKILLKWITENMTNDVIELINPTPSYDLYRNALYYKNGNFDYIYKLLDEYTIKYRPFNDEYVTFSISKEHPNRLNYWLYVDLNTNKLECIDIPGEFLLLMICFDITKKILKMIDYRKTTDKPKEVFEQIIENYDVDNPQYIKFLKPHQYKLFKDFLELFRISILADGIFVNDLFNLGMLFSKYTNSDRLILKDKDFNGIQGS